MKKESFMAFCPAFLCMGFILGEVFWIVKVTTKNKTSDDTHSVNEVVDISKNCTYGKFDGHEYVIYSVSVGPDSGITHSPNCPCMTNKVEVIQ